MNKKFSFLFLIFSNLYSSEKLSIVEASREVQELLGRSTINSYHGESARKLQNVLRRHHIQAREVSSDVASRFFRDDFGHANIKVGEGINAFAAIREQHPNAYRPWNKEQDEELHHLFSSGSSISDLMKKFGRKRGGITARLEKLGLR